MTALHALVARGQERLAGQEVKPSLPAGRHRDIEVHDLVLRCHAAATTAEKIHRHDLRPALLHRLPAEQPRDGADVRGQHPSAGPPVGSPSFRNPFLGGRRQWQLLSSSCLRVRHAHAHGPLPLPHPAPHHLHCAVPLRHHATSASAVTAPPPKPDVQAPPSARLSPALAAPAPPRSSPAAARSSSRAATGYAAALADACVRAGTLRRAARHARALLRLRLERPLEEGAAAVEAAVTVAGQQLDARVAALVRMLVAKGRAGMLAEALAEFAAICDHLLPTRPRARHAY